MRVQHDLGPKGGQEKILQQMIWKVYAKSIFTIWKEQERKATLETRNLDWISHHQWKVGEMFSHWYEQMLSIPNLNIIIL